MKISLILGLPLLGIGLFVLAYRGHNIQSDIKNEKRENYQNESAKLAVPSSKSSNQTSIVNHLKDRDRTGPKETLLEFNELIKFDVPTLSQKERLQEMYSDSTLLQEMASSLHIRQDDKYVESRELHQMRVIDYFEGALKWKSNPNKREIEATLENLLTAQIPSSFKDKRMRGVAKGNWIELYQILWKSNKEQARRVAMESGVTGTLAITAVQLMVDRSKTSKRR